MNTRLSFPEELSLGSETAARCSLPFPAAGVGCWESDGSEIPFGDAAGAGQVRLTADLDVGQPRSIWSVKACPGQLDAGCCEPLLDVRVEIQIADADPAPSTSDDC